MIVKARRRIVEMGAVLPKKDILALLDYIEDADKKIVQLIAERQQAREELAVVKRERDELNHMDYLTWHAIACKYRTERNEAHELIIKMFSALEEDPK